MTKEKEPAHFVENERPAIIYGRKREDRTCCRVSPEHRKGIVDRGTILTIDYRSGRNAALGLCSLSLERFHQEIECPH
ncbi:unnamed protein product [Haemonchus placei]|uniref:Uncharacterized protein n=1 Tax=Haemonchus placei TaxID=6290 RepID=A0A3P8ASS3_HAEPC|nr:unnamed protein product [Haemonchus placei]